MPSRPHLAISALAIALLAGSAAEAATMKLFRGYEFSPKVAYNNDTGEFLILGQEFDRNRDKYELKARRSTFSTNDRAPRLRARRTLANWYGSADVSYSSSAKSYLVTGPGYLHVNRRGHLESGGDFPGVFGPSARAATPLGGSGEWLALIEECKYGCWNYLHTIGADGELRDDGIPLDLPFKDEFGNSPRWQLGYEPDRGDVLVVWEDNLDRRPLGKPSRSIRAQRISTSGRRLGTRINIVRDPKGASQPHMVYHPQRHEWMIVYVQGKRIMGRFLRGVALSEPFRINGVRPGSTPSVAYSPQRDRYLVTWVRAGRDAGIYGRWVRANGKLLGDRFAINDDAGDQWVSEPGHSACNDSGVCLVTWVDNGKAPGGIVRGVYVQIP